MKYIITESTLDKVITKYLDELFPEGEMKIYKALDYDQETGEDFDDENHIVFYQGSVLYEEDSESFNWYSCDYFLIDAPQRVESNCPIVILNTPFSESLNGLFGDDWHHPFATWFTKRYDLPVKIVMT